jgi:translation initiation factor 2 subunit 2
MGDEEEPEFDFGKKKKPKKEKKEKKDKEDKDDDADKENQGDVVLTSVDWEKGPEYTYDEMLTRLYEFVENKNPTLGTAKKHILKPPQTVRVGSKKVAWVNFAEICQMIKRPSDHVVSFVLAEFGTEGSVAGSATARAEGAGADGQLILKGRYQPKHLESVLRKYIKAYVTCNMCKAADTELDKDSSTRLWVVRCNVCGADRTASSIKSGYHAVTKSDRKAAKLAK